MSGRIPKVGETHWGRRPRKNPEGTIWVQMGGLNEKGNGEWRLVKTVDYESDTDIPFLLPPEFNTPKKGSEGTQTTFIRKIDEGRGPEKG
jgi:hypothetical protein